MHKLLALLFIALVITSCVTNRRYQLMQKDDVNRREVAKDSIFRSYSLQPFDYKVQTNDLISVQYQSLSPKEYDFLSTQNVNNNANFIVGGALLIGELVDENGEIPFPVIGKVKVAGNTIYEIQEQLQELANRYLESAIVKVRLLNYRITMLGEVNKEGTITINNNRVNVLEAIGLMGGLTDLADKSSIKIIRQKDNVTTVAYLNLLDEDFVNSPYYYVHQNDILIVPALRQRPYRKYFGQNLTLIISSVSLLILAYNVTK